MPKKKYEQKAKKLPAAQNKPSYRVPTTQHKTPYQRSEAKKRGYEDIADAHGSARVVKGKNKGDFKRLSGKRHDKEQKKLTKKWRKSKIKNMVKKLYK